MRSDDTEPGQTMKITPAFTARSVLSDFGPWIVYGLLAATGHGAAAYAGGMIASLCQVVPQWRARRVKILDGVTLLFFSAGADATLVLHSSVFLKNNSVLAWSTFALVAWGSLLAGSPFTAQYAREAVPAEYWDNPGFRRVNVVITVVWGTIFAVNAALAAAIGLNPGGLSGRTGAWLPALPYIGTVFGIVFTNRYPGWVRRQR